jgi:hypothetical protein
MPEIPNCPRCGRELPEDAPRGLCPTCLLAAALAGPDEADALTPGPDSDVPSEDGGTAPDPRPTYGRPGKLDDQTLGPDPSQEVEGAPMSPVIVRYFGDYELRAELGRGGMGVVYRARTRLAPDVLAQSRHAVGVALGWQGRLEEAALAFREVIGQKPDCAEAHGNLGLALAALGKLEEAVVEFREMIRLKPRDASAHDGLGTALQARAISPRRSWSIARRSGSSPTFPGPMPTSAPRSRPGGSPPRPRPNGTRRAGSRPPRPAPAIPPPDASGMTSAAIGFSDHPVEGGLDAARRRHE